MVGRYDIVRWGTCCEVKATVRIERICRKEKRIYWSYEKKEQELQNKEELITKKLETVRKRKRDDVEKVEKEVRRKNEVEKGNLLDDKIRIVESDNKKLFITGTVWPLALPP